MKLKFTKMHHDVKTPERAHATDAGLDIFAYIGPKVEGVVVPYMRISPNTSAVVSTGIKVEVPAGYMLQVCNRSSVASKQSLVVGAEIIDSGYAGEIFVNLHNIGLESQFVQKNGKIAQLIMIPIVTPELVEVIESDLYSDNISERGEGGFGSTGV